MKSIIRQTKRNQKEETLRTRHQALRAQRLKEMAPEIVDVEGAAKLLGVSKRTIYKLAEEKRGRGR